MYNTSSFNDGARRQSRGTGSQSERCWLTTTQLQNKLQISRTTVWRWMQLGVIRAYRFRKSRTIYFLDSEVDDFLSNDPILPSGRLDKVGLGVDVT